MVTIHQAASSLYTRIALCAAIIAGAAVLMPRAAAAEAQVDRHCVCESGSGDCPYLFYFCCDFTSSGSTCDCVFLGFGGTCTA